ncbi:MAG: glycosyltransferase family 9 protein [Aggregatilineales bacterium]
MYTNFSRLFPTAPPPHSPARIVLIRPCCIGDVVLATAAFSALRRAYPNAHITWAVGGWSRQVVDLLDGVDAILDTGKRDLPVRSAGGFMRFVRDLRAGNFDLAVSLVRSPLMSAAVWMSGIPHRVGIDSNGRGFGYTVRVPVNPAEARHEAAIYLDVVRALGISTDDCYANVPVREADRQRVRGLLTNQGVRGDYLVIHPAGGNNPGMTMDSKRYPPQNFALLADTLAEKLNAQVILIGGPADAGIINAVGSQMKTRPQIFAGQLTFGEIVALALDARVYIGNDTGLTHLAAAGGAKTAMILGPSDPKRYAPYTPDSLALWQPVELRAGGVSAGKSAQWDWARDGISVEDATAQLLAFLGEN